MRTSDSDVSTQAQPALDARTFCMILFPTEIEEQIEAILDGVGVPGYSRAPDVIGRGPRGSHFNNHIWPGATGEIFTAVDPDRADELVRQLTVLSASLDAESHGLYGLHVLAWPCRALL